jgi:hypothetical protein
MAAAALVLTEPVDIALEFIPGLQVSGKTRNAGCSVGIALQRQEARRPARRD